MPGTGASTHPEVAGLGVAALGSTTGLSKGLATAETEGLANTSCVVGLVLTGPALPALGMSGGIAAIRVEARIGLAAAGEAPGISSAGCKFTP